MRISNLGLIFKALKTMIKQRIANQVHAAAPAAMLGIFLIAVLSAPPAFPQDQRKRKVPGLEKMTAGSSHLAFSGKVQSLDSGRNVLSVNTVQGGNTEIFPLKKGVHVSSADGEKLKPAALTPGTNIIIYYEQKGDRRTVKQIVILTSSAAEAKKSPPRS